MNFPLFDFRNQLHSLFEPLVKDDGVRDVSLDVYETANNIIVKAFVPGIEKENLRINLTNDVLDIEYETKESVEQKEDKYHFRESSYGKFKRRVRLPKSTDVTGLPEASLSNGVLRIIFNKRAGYTGNGVRQIAIS